MTNPQAALLRRRSWQGTMVAFLAGGLATCGSPSSPCAGVDCSSHGACFSVADAVYCECARNYHAVGLECIADSAVDPCLGVTCDEHGTCRIVGRGWVCDCGSGYYFDSGHCLPGTPCEAPWGWCDGACVDLESDEANCGGCSLACALEQPCTAGACGGLCPPETTWCGDRCHDLTTDREHCGACGRACATTEVCCAGACRTGTDHAGADLVVTDGTELTGLHGGLDRFEVPAGVRLAVAGGLEVCADTIDVSGLIDATGRGHPAGIAGEAGASRSPGVSGGAGAGTFGGGAGGGGRAGGGWGCNGDDERPHNPGEPGGSGLPGGYLAAGANGDVTVDRSLAAGSGGGGGGGGGGGEGSDCCGLRVEGGRGGAGGGGGAGGAAVALRARRSVSVAGTIRASGLPGAAGAAGRAGDTDSARDPQHAACVSACGDCDACGAPADHRYSCCPGLGPCGSAANDCCQRPCCYNYYGGTGGDGASGASGAGGGVLLDAPTVVFAGAAVVESLGGDGTAAAGGTVKLFTDGVLDAADRARLQAGRLCVAASGAADCTPVP